MFDRDSRLTLTDSVVESADSAVESADYWSRPTGNWPSGYRPLKGTNTQCSGDRSYGSISFQTVLMDEIYSKSLVRVKDRLWG